MTPASLPVHPTVPDGALRWASPPTVVHALAELAERPAAGERTAVALMRHDRSEPMTSALDRRLLHEHALRVAGALLAHAEPGDRALLLFPTSLEAVVALVGCFYAGVVAVFVPSPDHGHGPLEHIRSVGADAAPSVVLAQGGLDVGHATGLPGSLPVVRVELGAPDRHTVPSERLDRPLLPEPADLAFLQYTSGSTGAPRGVMVTHRSLVDNIRAIRMAFGGVPGESFCGWLPLHHDMGLVGQLLVPLTGDGTAVLMRPADFVRHPARWLQAITAHGAAFTAAPNFAYDLCARAIPERALDGVDLSRLRVALNGAEPVRHATLEAFQKRLAPYGLGAGVVKPSYGLAEATLFATGTPHDEVPRALCVARAALAHGRIEPSPGSVDADSVTVVSSGRAMTLDLQIVDPQTRRPLPDGVVGEIWLAGASLAAGYWGRPGDSAAVFDGRLADAHGHYLRTGDLGAVLDGWCYVTGRLKETIVVHGRTSYPFDVESAAEGAHPSTEGLPGVVFAVPTRSGEVAVLLHEVRPRPQSPAAAREVIDAISHQVSHRCGLVLADVGLLRVGTVKRTTSGKIRRLAMRESFLAGGLDLLGARLSPAVDEARRERAALPDGAPVGRPGSRATPGSDDPR
ncbi:MAG: fatty acyl-AMP ligase [Dermatophilaceae bacterium]